MSIEAERMRIALDLHDLGVKFYRQRMLRQFHDESADQIEARVRAWLATPTPQFADRPSRLIRRMSTDDHTS